MFNIQMAEDLSEWDTLVVGAGQSLSWQSAAGAHGRPGMRVSLASASTSHLTYAVKTFPTIGPADLGASAALNVRNAVTLPSDTNYIEVLSLKASSVSQAVLQLRNTSGVIECRLIVVEQSGVGKAILVPLGDGEWINAVIQPSSDNSTSDGLAQLFIDGDLKDSMSIIHRGRFNYDRVWCGFTWTSFSGLTGTVDIGPVQGNTGTSSIAPPPPPSEPRSRQSNWHQDWFRNQN